MKLLAGSLMLLVIIAGLLWWQGQRSSDAVPRAQNVAVAETASASLSADLPPPSAVGALTGTVFPAIDLSEFPIALPEDEADAQLEAVRNANTGPDPFLALKALAQQGNAIAARGVGRMLTRCLLASVDMLQRMLDRKQADLEDASRKLRVLQRGSGSTAEVARAERRVASLQHHVDSVRSQLRACENATRAQAWGGFDWYDRSRRMGYEWAVPKYLERLAEVFGQARMVGRDPQRAMALRDRGRAYLDEMLRHCSREHLRWYARYMPRLKDLGAYRRYVLALVKLGPDRSARDVQALASKRKSLASRRKRYGLPELDPWLSDARQVAARYEADRMWTRCLNR